MAGVGYLGRWKLIGELLRGLEPCAGVRVWDTDSLENRLISRNELLCGRRARVRGLSGHVHADLHIPLST